MGTMPAPARWPSFHPLHRNVRWRTECRVVLRYKSGMDKDSKEAPAPEDAVTTPYKPLLLRHLESLLVDKKKSTDVPNVAADFDDIAPGYSDEYDGNSE